MDRALRKEKFTVEYDPTAKMDYTSGPGGAYSYEQVKSKKAVQRDQLIAQYDVDPALTRVRSYLAASLLASLSASVKNGESYPRRALRLTQK